MANYLGLKIGAHASFERFDTNMGRPAASNRSLRNSNTFGSLGTDGGADHPCPPFLYAWSTPLLMALGHYVLLLVLERVHVVHEEFRELIVVGVFLCLSLHLL